jgi:phage protein U
VSRPIPMIDDLALDMVAWVRQRTMQGYVSQPVAGLEGHVQQRLGRASHEIELAGVLIGEGVADALAGLQKKAAAGEEVTFTADITSALELDKVVILAAEFLETAGQPGRYEYRLRLRESPPLPEPATLAPFGGLEGVDLGFDTDILGDIADVAGELQDAIDAVTDVLGDLEALAGLADLNLGNPLTPLQDEAGGLGQLGAGAGAAASALSSLIGGS